MPYRNHPIFDPLTFGILMLGWLVYIAFSPIYIFTSGLPQPADFAIVIVAAISMTLFFLKQKIIFNRVFSILCLMVALFFTTNICYFYFYKDIQFLYSSVYYVFNAGVFITTIILFKQYPVKVKQWGRYAVFVSILIEFVWLLVFDSKSTYRETGSFNNPNQLGYWGLLSACYLLILNYGERMKWIDLFFFLLCGYIMSEALSRAVMASYALVLIVFFLGSYTSLITKIAMAGLLVFYSFIQVTVFDNPAFILKNFESIERVVERIESIQTEGGSVLAERGYDRIIDNPEFLFFGAGEGAYWRFSHLGGGLELHSGLGTILFSYGFLGLGLFGAFILTIFQRAPVGLWIILFAIMGYGITHQHVRFTGFWLFLGLSYAVTRYVIIPHREQGFSRLPQ